MPWPTKPSCAPFSGEISGSTAVIIPMPKNDTEASSSRTIAAVKFASGIERPKKSATTMNSSAARIRP